MEKFEYKGIMPLRLTTEERMYNGHLITDHRIYLDSDEYLWVASGYGDLDKGFPSAEQAIATFQLFVAAPPLLSALIKAVEQEDRNARAFFHRLAPYSTEVYTFPYWYSDAKAAIQAAISQPENVKG